MNTMIAIVTDDGTTISPHFGRSMFYEIITLEDGRVTERRRVAKDGHHTWAGHTHGEHEEHHGPGHDAKHAAMTAPLAGVSVLVARGMGMGAHIHLTAAGIRPILTDVLNIDDAVQGYHTNTLTDNPRRLHDHGLHHN
jgi:predicted Fe-Mo cluster-binding NifX family protein